MNWTEITPEEIREAENWWNSRTPEERERDYPRPMYSNAAGFFPCGWRVFAGREQAEIAMDLMGVKLRTAAPERKPAIDETEVRSILDAAIAKGR